MDPPPPPPPLSAAVPPQHHQSYPDSVDSSPRSRTTDNWDDSLASLPPKLRLMCSYGGHIVPRPHDKSLCYVGGDTRIVVVDRITSLAELSGRLSKTLINGRDFNLKYQLPNEDLDSLISVSTDEDLENMIEEYDRTAGGCKPSRLRLFLFPLKPDSSQSIGPLLESSTKSEDWFLNALNGAGLLNRGFSDSDSVNCLLGLDVDSLVNSTAPVSSNQNLEASQAGNSKNGKQQGQDVHSVPDSPMMETTSSFGSTSSSPSLANLPPIRVHVQDQKMGIEEQFAQMGFGASPPPLPTTIIPASSVAAVVNEYPNRVFSDDERSDHGFVPPQSVPQALPPPSQQKSSGGLELPSPDSVSSDNSISNAISRSKPMIYQDTVVQIPGGVTRIPANPGDQKINISDPNTRVQINQQVQDSGYVFQPQFEQQQQQQQFIHAGAHYIQQHPLGPMQIPGYYSVYPPQQQHHHHPQHQLDQHYPVYYMPARQPQPYNMSGQPNISEATTPSPTSRPQTPPSPAMVATPAAYNPARNVPVAKPDMPAGVYRTATSAAPQFVQVHSNQHQQQYVGFSQIRHPSQSVATNTTPNYAYELQDPAHNQIYYTQPLAPTLSTHYQTMTAATAGGMPDTSAQLSSESMKPQIRTSQPI